MSVLAVYDCAEIRTHSVIPKKFATKMKENFDPRSCALESSDIHGGTILMMKPMPRPVITRAQMNMFELILPDWRAPPRTERQAP
jgi:hypothetical protein